MFTVELSNNAKRGFDRCSRDYQEKIRNALNILRESSCPFRLYDLKKIGGRENVYRIRIGRYRMQYEVFKEKRSFWSFP
ncbi:MAG: type II toxin-antitoxin system RelE/ParE family toxin [Candidatus ainarchaeum sp.]|nr:type II toxin-antitoxin system RelE/ParE family toxin [Candidatus ainarchaeum sp.]